MEETTTSAASPTSTQPATQPATTLGDASAALALADSSFATPQTETPPASTPAAATAQPGETPAPAVEPSTKAEGEPPAWRWQDILKNARETSAKEAETRVRQEVEQQYAGLKDFSGMDANERAGLLIMHRAIAGDPQARARVADVHPHLAQSLGWVQAPQADTEPEPDLQAQDGSLVYSAARQREWREWNNRQLTSQLTKQFEDKLQPLQSVAQTFQQREAQATYTTTVSGVVAKMEAADPVFAHHKKDVGALLQADARLMALALGTDTTPPDPETALEIAWGRVYRAKVLPAQQQQATANVLTDLQRSAVAATTNPATASTATPKPTLGNARAALEHAYAVTRS